MNHLVDALSGRVSPWPMRRPSRGQFGGVNWQSPQAVGLKAWFPLWGAMAGQRDTELLRGLTSSVFGSAILPSYDRVFGPVALGGGDGDGAGTARVIRIPNSAALKVNIGMPWAYSFWFKTLGTAGAAVNQVIWSYNSGTNPWPGTAITLDTSNQLACNTESATNGDSGFKSTMNPYDQQWHHVLFVQIPSGDDGYTSTNTYYIDGALDGTNSGCARAGDPGATRDAFFMGDELGSPPLGGSMCDFRIYSGLKDLGFARHLYNQRTRWDLYASYIPFIGAGVSRSAALTGTALSAMTESDVIAGGETIIITLSGDTWISN